MQPMPNNIVGSGGSGGSGQAEQLDRDVLVTRLLDARAGETDWTALRDLAGSDKAIWDEIIGACRQGRRLERGFELAAAGTESCEMPRLGFVGSTRTGRSALLGWAAAAALALGLVAQQAGMIPSSGRNNQASLGPAVQPSGPELLQQYIASGVARGTVVGELPDQHVVETRPTEDGGHEVFFVRQILERTIVTDFRTLGMSEDGTPMLIKSAPTIAKAKY